MEVEFTPINQVYEEKFIDGEFKMIQAQCNKCTGKNIQKINGKNICIDCGADY